MQYPKKALANAARAHILTFNHIFPTAYQFANFGAASILGQTYVVCNILNNTKLKRDNESVPVPLSYPGHDLKLHRCPPKACETSAPWKLRRNLLVLCQPEALKATSKQWKSEHLLFHTIAIAVKDWGIGHQHNPQQVHQLRRPLAPGRYLQSLLSPCTAFHGRHSEIPAG